MFISSSLSLNSLFPDIVLHSSLFIYLKHKYTREVMMIIPNGRNDILMLSIPQKNKRVNAMVIQNKIPFAINLIIFIVFFFCALHLKLTV